MEFRYILIPLFSRKLMEKIHASFVIEIMGRPPENVKDALSQILTAMEKEKGVKIINKEVHEPLPLEDSKDLFTAFMNVDLEMESITNYIGMIFTYLPSHVEIIKPEKLSILKVDLNDLGNSILQRMHNYDAVTKNAIVERDILLENIKKHSPELLNKIKEIYSNTK